MSLRPIKDFLQLFPVIDLFEVQLLDRSPGDDHSIEAVLLDLIESLVEHLQVLGRSILGGMGTGMKQDYLHL
ncbi:hypothetical protein D3C87_1448500 [compost metagenome]